jgi:hypothetical protein
VLGAILIAPDRKHGQNAHENRNPINNHIVGNAPRRTVKAK